MWRVSRIILLPLVAQILSSTSPSLASAQEHQTPSILRRSFVAVPTPPLGPANGPVEKLAPLTYRGESPQDLIPGHYSVKFHDRFLDDFWSALEKHSENVGVNLSQIEGFISLSNAPGYQGPLSQDVLGRVRNDTQLVEDVDQSFRMYMDGNDEVESSPDVGEGGVRSSDPSNESFETEPPYLGRRFHLLARTLNNLLPGKKLKESRKFVSQPTDHYNLEMISKPNASSQWPHTYEYWKGGATGVAAYVFGAGINIGHEQIAGRAYHFNNTITSPFAGNATMSDESGTGTFIAGIIGGRTVGVAPNVSIVNVKVCTKVWKPPSVGRAAQRQTVNQNQGGNTTGTNESGIPKFECLPDNVMAALEFVIKEHNAYKREKTTRNQYNCRERGTGFELTCQFDRGAVIQLSIAKKTAFPATLNGLFGRAIEAGIPIVAPALYENTLAGMLQRPAPTSSGYPCSVPEIVCVGSLDANYRREQGSSLDVNVNITAPGANVQSLNKNLRLDPHELITRNGTANAAAHVSGVLATIIGYEGIKDDAKKAIDRMYENQIANRHRLIATTGNLRQLNLGIVNNGINNAKRSLGQAYYIPRAGENNADNSLNGAQHQPLIPGQRVGIQNGRLRTGQGLGQNSLMQNPGQQGLDLSRQTVGGPRQNVDTPRFPGQVLTTADIIQEHPHEVNTQDSSAFYGPPSQSGQHDNNAATNGNKASLLSMIRLARGSQTPGQLGGSKNTSRTNTGATLASWLKSLKTAGRTETPNDTPVNGSPANGDSGRVSPVDDSQRNVQGNSNQQSMHGDSNHQTMDGEQESSSIGENSMSSLGSINPVNINRQTMNGGEDHGSPQGASMNGTPNMPDIESPFGKPAAQG